ncbi:hypothetical protein ABZ401_12880 [Streptomyces sp. NPDC005892]|uniref:hypothetical protein n=1 Tax=Streptomyces sp. NPDC005892 TaxID=3155593 RepID=UPI0033D327E0
MNGHLIIQLADGDHAGTNFVTGRLGTEIAHLKIGSGVTIDATDASLDLLREIAAAASDLVDWAEDRERAADVPNQVAAEDGVRSIGVPYQRGPVAA